MLFAGIVAALQLAQRICVGTASDLRSNRPMEVARISPADRYPCGRKRSAQRPDQLSRITNHVDQLPGVNGNSAAARRFRDLVRCYLADAGGLERCSVIRVGQYRLLAGLTVRAEQLEADRQNGKDVAVADQCMLANTITRLSVRLGLERVPRDVIDLDPLQYAARYREAAE
jgi:hypothetical protein